jgi:hypothetical protein
LVDAFQQVIDAMLCAAVPAEAVLPTGENWVEFSEQVRQEDPFHEPREDISDRDWAVR